MDYAKALEKLEELNRMLSQQGWNHDDVVRLYGEVSEVYQQVIPSQRIKVPGIGAASSEHPNLFEAGFMSGRSFHSGAGKMELLKAIGAVKRLAEHQQQTRERVGPTATGSTVFVVHGHNEAVLQAVARFVERLGLPVTVLREQPNKGRTIIEKVEAQSDIGFAIVLLTADDRGGTKDAPLKEQRLRARQNVVLELGYFIGKLGRPRVCALYEEGVEIPSDYQGVAFVLIDKREAWKLELAREMKSADLPVDLNDAI